MADSGYDRTRPEVHLRIGAERLAAGSGGTFEHVDPCTGDVDAVIPLAGPTEIDRSVRLAHEAFLTWRDVRPAERRRLLSRLADLIEKNADEFVRRAVLDNGMPVTSAAGLAAGAVEWTRYYAGFADKISGRVASSFGPDGEFGYTLAQPYGVIGAIITWNGPLTSLSMKVPPALAAGNTVVVKPSELTPFAADLFADLVAEAGLPPGTVSVLPGTGAAGAALVEHPLVQKISFTGGPVTAKAILRACAEQMKPALLELGGKSANLIFEDADLDVALTWGALRVLGTVSGQGCAFPTRMLVQESVYEEAVDRVARIVKGIRVGDPWDTDTDIGPVVSQAAVDRILGMIERARQDGARLVAGGGRAPGPLSGGYYLEPTVFADVGPHTELGQVEVFGPVLSMMPFSTEEEAIEIANCTRYGLSSYVQTRDVRRAHRVAERLTAGATMINGAPNLMVNRPFGGQGYSGYGKEGGPDGLAEFQRTKTIAMV
ncbi:aldehyde dehydrogenase [Frankia sp. CNm7]|uniref:Aldehyde dehydrogenase n=1 Tax=Frankia nepalensis TaxID=1836974 RepID=A0A937RQV5_9ACTN|nr:aldehyde dehydrogenase family protein [Frankia nepalensis]MBL7500941.1 aldehyde dehydrogenase [Frankia nepalensis]MBL7510084.1 aldehyde dehydrogenase [Frankia nepalensis]MBL7521745.1 aldehyde dehydrogenase [Frankia nepalensis]MBL7633310.1 aldehyde dehydrogenase [Frankia nepalensis]